MFQFEIIIFIHCQLDDFMKNLFSQLTCFQVDIIQLHFKKNLNIKKIIHNFQVNWATYSFGGVMLHCFKQRWSGFVKFGFIKPN
jgi:hypothetical protein